MNSKYEGIVILGAPRSGTTLLRRLMDSHPSIVCPSETNLLSAASRFLDETEFAGGLSVGVIPGLGFSGFSEEDILRRLRAFLFQFWREILAQSGKEIWAEKTAVDAFHINAIQRICGDRCRYVCIHRHALDVVCSMKDLADKMDAYLPELHHYIGRYSSISEASAHAWCDANQNILEFAETHPEWCIQLKYEDLVQNPAQEMNRIFRFLEVSEQPKELFDSALAGKQLVGLGDWKTYGKRLASAEQVGRYTSMDVWTVQRLAPLVNPQLAKLGYSEIAASNHILAADEGRSRELGRMVAAMNLKGAPQEGSESDA